MCLEGEHNMCKGARRINRAYYRDAVDNGDEVYCFDSR
jgi:hypothetical protein